MKIKLLICGSAGFLMSNFIRYLLYRTKEYDIISVDWLIQENDHKRIYKHRKHKFYLGDLRNKDYVDKLIKFEQPDFIVNISYNGCIHWSDATKIYSNLEEQGIPTIQIIPASYQDVYGTWEFIRRDNLISSIFKNNNCLLEIPACFGIRQKNGPFIRIIKHLIEDERSCCVSNREMPYVYGEDVASLIWFLIENNKKGHYTMPKLGSCSEEYIALFISKVLGLKRKIEVTNDDYTNIELNSKIEGWMSDFKSLDDALEKTIKWYNANRWALHL